jgi:hypothetical protein
MLTVKEEKLLFDNSMIIIIISGGVGNSLSVLLIVLLGATIFYHQVIGTPLLFGGQCMYVLGLGMVVLKGTNVLQS